MAKYQITTDNGTYEIETDEPVQATSEQPKQSMLSQIGQGIKEQIPTIGMLGGGAIGLVSPFPGGSLVGAGLGGAAGKALENVIDSFSGKPKTTKELYTDPIKAGKESIEFEALGGIAGQAIKGSRIAKNFIKRAVTPPVEADILNALDVNKGNFAKLKVNTKNTIPEIHRISINKNIPLNSVENFKAAAEAAQDEVMSEFNTIAKNKNIILDMNSVNKAMVDEMTPKFVRETPPTKVKTILDRADFYKQKQMSLRKAISELRETNRMLDSYYSANQITREQALKDPNISYRIKEAEQLRKVIYDALGTESRQMMRKWGALQDVYEATMGSGKKAYFKGADARAPIMNLPGAQRVADTAESAGNLKIGTAVKNLFGRKTDPNSLIESAFNRYGEELKTITAKYPKSESFIKAYLGFNANK